MCIKKKEAAFQYDGKRHVGEPTQECPWDIMLPNLGLRGKPFIVQKNCWTDYIQWALWKIYRPWIQHLPLPGCVEYKATKIAMQLAWKCNSMILESITAVWLHIYAHRRYGSRNTIFGGDVSSSLPGIDYTLGHQQCGDGKTLTPPYLMIEVIAPTFGKGRLSLPTHTT